MIKQPFNGYYPITQHFGQNFNGYYQTEGLKGHEGLDLGLPMGTPVLSAVNGVVTLTSKDIQRGEGVYILSTDKFQYNDQECFLQTIYWHLKDQSITVDVGQTVTVGQQIGLSNNTGNSTGPHLHFGVQPIATDGSRKGLVSYYNGYAGCIDPLLYLQLETPAVSYPVLKLGSRGASVGLLQEKLHIIVDKIFGPNTLAAVKNFQTAHGLVADGVVGSKTWSVLLA